MTSTSIVATPNRAPRGRASFLPWTVGLWAVGVQVGELPATLGAILTTLLVLISPKPILERRAWQWVLLALIAWSAVAPLVAGHPPVSYGLARLADFVLIPIAALAFRMLPEKSRYSIAFAAGATLVLSTLVACAQHFGWWPPLSTFSRLEWTALPFWRVYEPVSEGAHRFMAGGLLLHRLKYANVTAIATLLFFGAAALRVRYRKWFLGVALIGAVGVTLFPYARAAAVSMLIAMCTCWLLVRGSSRLLRLLALVAGVLILVLATPTVRSRFVRGLSLEGNEARLALVEAGLNCIRANPLAGVGLGGFSAKEFSPPDAPPEAREHGGKAHNQFLTAAAEAGIPAAALFVALLGLLAWEGLRAGKQGGLLAGVVVLLVLLALLHDPLFHPETSMAMMLALGGSLGGLRRVVDSD